MAMHATIQCIFTHSEIVALAQWYSLLLMQLLTEVVLKLDCIVLTLECAYKEMTQQCVVCMHASMYT